MAVGLAAGGCRAFLFLQDPAGIVPHSEGGRASSCTCPEHLLGRKSPWQLCSSSIPVPQGTGRSASACPHTAGVSPWWGQATGALGDGLWAGQLCWEPAQPSPWGSRPQTDHQPWEMRSGLTTVRGWFPTLLPVSEKAGGFPSSLPLPIRTQNLPVPQLLSRPLPFPKRGGGILGEVK